MHRIQTETNDRHIIQRFCDEVNASHRGCDMNATQRLGSANVVIMGDCGGQAFVDLITNIHRAGYMR